MNFVKGMIIGIPISLFLWYIILKVIFRQGEDMITKRARILEIGGHPMSGLWYLYFDNGDLVHIESGIGVRGLASAFGAIEGTGDLKEKIVVKPHEIQAYANALTEQTKQFGFHVYYMETSAKTGINVEESFDLIGKQVIDGIERGILKI